MRFVTAWCVVSLSPLILVCFVFSLLKRLPSHPTLKFNHFYIYGSERTKLQRVTDGQRVPTDGFRAFWDCLRRNLPCQPKKEERCTDICFYLGRNSGGHNFPDTEVQIPTVITSSVMTSHSMTPPVMSSGRMEYDCISRLVEIDAILEEDRDETLDSNYEMTNSSRSNEVIDLDLLVTLKNPTISKQKQIQIGLQTLSGTA